MIYLFISSHVDDVQLACGGTISELVELGHNVDVISMSSVYDKGNLTHEFNASMEVLGVRAYDCKNFTTRLFHTESNEILQYLFSLKGYNYIFAPSATDFHSDHSTVGRACERVFKSDNLITYQHPWNSRELKTNYFVELGKHHIEKKIKSLACFHSQQHRAYLHSDYTWANALNSGVTCGVKYAEAFQSINIIV